MPTEGSGTSLEIVGSAIIVCLAVLVWLVLVPLTSLVLASEEPKGLRAERGSRRPRQIGGRPVPIG